MHAVYLSMGSNMGNRRQAIELACRRLNEKPDRLIKVSSLYETEPLGFDSSHTFINCCALLHTPGNAMDLMKKVLSIENDMGRKRHGTQYGDRKIDVDILFFDDEIIDEPKLKIPHPRLHERMFVLKPLQEIAPDFLHPQMDMNIAQITLACRDHSRVEIVHLPAIEY